MHLECESSRAVVRVPLVVREDLQGGTRTSLLSVFFTKNIFTAVVFTCRVLLINFVNFFVLTTSLAVF